jgi:Tol biopolymer transport system component/DNA-binding winged helix-turn-helix (wHTH) protein
VPLPPRALGVLGALVARAGSVISKQALLDASWPDAFVTESSLLEVIRVLRDALGDDRLNPAYIQTVHRRGYRFVAAVQPVEPAPVKPRISEPRTLEPSNHRPLEPWAPLIAASVAATTATIGMAIVFALFGQRAPEPRPTTRFTISLPENTTIDPSRGSVAVSLDGTRMVYVATHDGRPRLFLRTIDRDAPEPIDGSDGAADPFFSPDGDWIGFFAHGSLKKLRVEGGTPVVLSAARAGAGATWGRDRTIVFGGGPGGSLARVSQEGGEPVVLAAPVSGSREVSYGWPDLLPDSRALIYTAVSVADSVVAVLDLDTGRRGTIVESAAFGRYSPTGHVVFARRGRLEAAPFSLSDRTITAAPRPILRGLATTSAAFAGPRFAFSRSGSLIYVPGMSSDVDDRLHWLDVQGRLEPLPIPPTPISAMDVAPNLRQLALTVEGDNGQDLWVGDLERGALSRLTADGQSVSPAWRPDGLEIAFAYSKAGPFNLFLRPAELDGAAQPLLESPWNQFPTSWSPDGRLIAFTEFNPLTGADIWIVDLETRARRQIVRTLFDESYARFSPDGRWLAYMANESGRWDVFIRPIDGSSPRVQVSTSGGAWPCWSVDGSTLYFSVDGEAAAAAVQIAPSLRVSTPIVISGPGDLQLAGGRADLHRVLVRQGISPARRELRVVLGWFAEITRLLRAPA